MKYILVTGAAGNIGSALVKKLLDQKKYFVVGIDNLITGCESNLPESGNYFKFIKVDVNNLSDIASVFYTYNFEYVFHFSALVGVFRTLKNPIMVLNDVNGLHNIFSISKNSNVKRIFFSSSSEVYGEPVTIPQNEITTPMNSRLPYSVVKNLGEVYCRAYFKEHRLPYTIFRFFNTYGPCQTEDFVIPRFIKSAINNSPITINGDGNQTRTFCYIDDNIETIYKCLENDFMVNDVINIGSDFEISIIDLASLIIRLTNSKSEILHLPQLDEGDMSRRRPDITKMRYILNRDLITLENGISKLINTYKI